MKQSDIRKPCVAGQFYPGTSEELNEIIASFVDKATLKQEVIGCILPHAGYIYSGRVAAQTLATVKIKDTIVLLGPNHTGQGETFSLCCQGYWQTPLGNVGLDKGLASLFLSKSKYLKDDCLAHLDEHSLEVQLPLLQYFKKDFKIVPIAIKSQDLSQLQGLAQELANVIQENNLGDSVMLIASSDMTHYEPQKIAQKNDGLAIKEIIALNENKLQEVISEFSISMCGFAPVAVLIKAAKLLGSQKGRLIKYQTSGDATQDLSSVVGYAGITIY
ncbi:MAG: AmmeMemoRadiSam system protein B [Candidatus Omnitrophica bacterium]|nr:AmmeMemoRadiSam system protein B [Candidatus Omnitrophota bacterium]